MHLNLTRIAAAAILPAVAFAAFAFQPGQAFADGPAGIAIEIVPPAPTHNGDEPPPLDGCPVEDPGCGGELEPKDGYCKLHPETLLPIGDDADCDDPRACVAVAYLDQMVPDELWDCPEEEPGHPGGNDGCIAESPGCGDDEVPGTDGLCKIHPETLLPLASDPDCDDPDACTAVAYGNVIVPQELWDCPEDEPDHPGGPIACVVEDPDCGDGDEEDEVPGNDGLCVVVYNDQGEMIDASDPDCDHNVCVVSVVQGEPIDPEKIRCPDEDDKCQRSGEAADGEGRGRDDCEPDNEPVCVRLEVGDCEDPPADVPGDEPGDGPQDPPAEVPGDEPQGEPVDEPADEPQEQPSDEPLVEQPTIVPGAPAAGGGFAQASPIGLTPLVAALGLAIAGGVTAGAAIGMGRKK